MALLADRLGEHSYCDVFSGCGYDVAENRSTAATDVADEIIRTVTASREELEAVRGASLGERVEVTLEIERVQSGLVSIRYAIEEGCRFWDRQRRIVLG